MAGSPYPPSPTLPSTSRLPISACPTAPSPIPDPTPPSTHPTTPPLTHTTSIHLTTASGLKNKQAAQAVRPAPLLLSRLPRPTSIHIPSVDHPSQSLLPPLRLKLVQAKAAVTNKYRQYPLPDPSNHFLPTYLKSVSTTIKKTPPHPSLLHRQNRHTECIQSQERPSNGMIHLPGNSHLLLSISPSSRQPELPNLGLGLVRHFFRSQTLTLSLF
jgi:hypothetical protein